VPLDYTTVDIVRAGINGELSEVHTAMPGRIVSYDASTRTAIVQPSVSRTIFDISGNAVQEVLPQIPNVPVGFYQAGGFIVAGPVNTGDFVFLIFSEVNMGQWRASGQDSNPGDVTRFSLSSPIAIPICANPENKTIQSASTAGTNLVIGVDGADEQIVISSSDIKLGASATGFVALASKIDLFIQTVMSWTPVANDGGAALHLALATAGFTNTTTTAATLVKAK